MKYISLYQNLVNGSSLGTTCTLYMIVQGSFLLGGEGCLKVLGLGLFKGFVHLHVYVHLHVGYTCS